MAKYRFNLFWSDEDNGYVATCPDFPGVSGLGETPGEALAEAEVSLQLSIEAYQEEGWELPASPQQPSYSGRLLLRLAKSLHAQLAQQADVEGISLNTLVTTYLAERSALQEVRSQLQSMGERLIQLQRDFQSQSQQRARARGVTSTKVEVSGSPLRSPVGSQTGQTLTVQPLH